MKEITENIATDIQEDKIKKKKNKDAKKRSSRNFNMKWLKIFRIKILDLYILRKFLGTYIMATILFLAVISMFDITEKLDAFLTAPLKETVFDYFASFLPFFANQLSPLFVFISVIFFTTKMADHSEIIAILASGVSYRRLLVPYMVGATLIAAMTFALSNYIIPPTNVARINFTNKYVKNKAVTSGSNIQLQVSPGVVAYMGRFENSNKTGYSFSLDKYDGLVLVSRLSARTAQYDTLKTYHWKLSDYQIHEFDNEREKITKGKDLDTLITIEPKDFLISANDQETLTTPELTTYIESQRKRGVGNLQAFEIEKEKRIASTLAAFILTLIGMSLSSKKVKGGMGINIGIGLVLSFSYILFSTITASLAINDYTSAFVAMEIPNAIYLLIGIFLFYRVSRRG